VTDSNELCTAIDELIEWVGQYIPFKPSDDVDYYQLCPGFRTRELEKFDDLDLSVATLAARLGIRLPDGPSEKLDENSRLLGFTELHVKDRVVGEKCHERNQVMFNDRWRNRLLILRALVSNVDDEVNDVNANDQPASDRPLGQPRWDRASRTFYLGEKAIRKYQRHPAKNNMAILDAFEEEGWPGSIDDPLPPRSGIDPKKRLRDAVRSLNDKQRDLRFSCDGTGERIRWNVSERGA
jgi:hypothetical protein